MTLRPPLETPDPEAAQCTVRLLSCLPEPEKVPQSCLQFYRTKIRGSVGDWVEPIGTLLTVLKGPNKTPEPLQSLFIEQRSRIKN